MIGSSTVVLPLWFYQKQPERLSPNQRQNQQSFLDFNSILRGTNSTSSKDEDRQSAKPYTQPGLLQAYGAHNEGISIDPNTHTYSLLVDIGDDAVAFQARPIIAPVSTETQYRPKIAERAQPQPSGTGQSPDIEPQMQQKHTADQARTVARLDLNTNEQKTSGRNDEITARINLRTIVPAKTPSSPHQHTPLASLNRSPASSVSNKSISFRATPGDKSLFSMAQYVASQTQLFVRLITAAREYRVSIRGIQLTAEDRQQLVGEIEAALREYGFSNRPIIIADRQGG